MDKTQYFSILKQLHDICRDLPAPTLTGMDAYNEIMNYLYLRHLSDNQVDANADYNLKNLYENYCTDKKIKQDQHNAELNKIASKSGQEKPLFYKELSNKLLPGLSDQKRNKKTAFAQIMGDEIQNFKLDIGRLTNIIHQDENTTCTDGGQKAQKLINKIYSEGFLPTDSEGRFNIHMFPYDAVGEGFEKFMSDAGSKGGNWGQYFTNPQVIEWVINKCGAEKTHKIIDPFAGSGGFILQTKRLTKVKPGNIYAHENDDKIYKFLKFNSNIASLELDNIEKGDTFDYSDYIKSNENKFDRVFTNPPFGMSIDILLSTTEKTKFWSVLKSGKSTIKDSMGLAMYVNYALLKPGGVGGIVCERGILNNGTEGNSWQKNLRKFLLENANIKEILLLPKGIFSHTTFDTACVIMEKGTPTKQVVFHQGYFKDEDKGKGDKKMYVKENILTISLEQIVNKDWSLKYDDYVERKEETYKGIQYKTLGEVCKYNIGGTPATKEPKYWNGTNLWVSISDLDENIIKDTERKITDLGIEKSSVKLIPKNTLLYSFKLTVGKTGITGNEMYCNEAIVFFTSLEDISQEYLRIYLKLLSFEKIKHLSNSQIGESLNKSTIGQIKIPILPADHQARIVEYMDKTFGQDYKRLDKIVSKFKDYDLFKLLLDENYSGFDDLLKMYEDIVWAEEYYQRFTTKYKNMLIQRCFSMVPGKTMTLGELVEISKGTFNTQDISGKGNIPYYNSGASNPVSTHTDYTIDKPEYIVFIKDGGDKNNKHNLNCGMAKSYYLNGKSAINNHNLIFTTSKINCKYLYNYLEAFRTKNMDLAKYNSGLGNITMKQIERITIKVPSAEDQEKVVKMIDEINKEEGEFSNQVKALKESIIKLYQCVEQLVNTNVSNLNQEADQTIDQQAESDDESEQEQLDEESESESDDEEPVELEIKGKPYIRLGTNVYVKTKKGRGELYGTWNASTNKVTKLTKEFNV